MGFAGNLRQEGKEFLPFFIDEGIGFFLEQILLFLLVFLLVVKEDEVEEGAGSGGFSGGFADGGRDAFQ